MNNQIDFISQLPTELSLLILSNCSSTDLAKCCQVSKVWKTLAEDNSLWKPIAQSHFDNSILKQSYKSYLKNNIFSSKEQILERIQAFANRIRKGQNGRFICSTDDDNLIEIHIGDGTDRIDTEDRCKMVKDISDNTIPKLPDSFPVINGYDKSIIKPLRICAINSLEYKYKASLKFPKFEKNKDLYFPEMERKIYQILISKIGKFNSQQEWENKCYRAASVIIGLFFLILVSCRKSFFDKFPL